MADTGVQGAYRFGPFHLEVRERRLSRGSEVIPLRLKVFDTLRVLVENAGRLVTKQELLDTVWPETTVEENNLNHNVSDQRGGHQLRPLKRVVWELRQYRKLEVSSVRVHTGPDGRCTRVSQASGCGKAGRAA